MILVMAIFIAGCGALLLYLLFMRIRQVESETKLKKYRSTTMGVADLLNYAAVVDDGIIICKNGALMSAWLYQADDHGSSTDVEQEQLSFRLNQALAPLGNGWMLHVDAVRRVASHYPAANTSHFTDWLCAAIDEERRQLFETLGKLYEGYFVLVLTWFPPLLAQRRLVEWMFDDNKRETNSRTRTLDLLVQFKREITGIESRLSSAVQLTRLGTHVIQQEDGSTISHDDFLSWLHFCITGLHHPIQLPCHPMYIDRLIGGQELWGGVIPKIGEHFIQVVAVDGFPLASTPGILTSLAELACAYRWSSRFIFLDLHQSVKHLDKYRKKWRQKVRGFFDQVFNTHSGYIDQDALAMMQDAEQAIAEVNSGLVAVGYYTSVIVLMHPERTTLEQATRYVAKQINRLGFTARIETINTLEAYLGSLPGHGVENIRRPLLNTLNLADLLPTSTIWTGLAQAPCPFYPLNSPALLQAVTQGATPFRLNLHVRDLGHSFIFGPTGAGKSTHLALLAAQLRRYAGMSIYAFDKGLSLYPLTKAIWAATEGKSGLHFAIADEATRLAFCPLQFLQTVTDRAWALTWLDSVLALNGVNTTPAQRNEIVNALLSMQQSGARTLSEFSITVQDSAIREALQQYTVDGAMGYLLDAEQDGLKFSDFTVFEMENLMQLGEKWTLPVLLYLFRRIECQLQGQPAAILLDEAWLLLGHPVFRAKIREWLKVLRKANCLVLMATQSLSDAIGSGILDVIVESTATKIFLPNSAARDEDTTVLYRRMGLNNRQIELLANAIPKQHYYAVSEQGRRLYELALGELALAFVGVSDKESLAVIRELIERLGQDWIYAWLTRRGVELKRYLPHKEAA
jgi:type IV secretion system protein TrbE